MASVVMPTSTMSICARLAIRPNCRQLNKASTAHPATRRFHSRRARSQVSQRVSRAASNEGTKKARFQPPNTAWLAACIHMKTGGFSA